MKKLICYKERIKNNIQCKRTCCEHWIDDKQCVLSIQHKDEKITVNDISNMFSLTRTKICQIENNFIKEIQSKIVCV
jgi:hypothetical protein